MKTLLVTLIAGIFTFSPVQTPNNSVKLNSEINSKHNDPAGDWDAILKAILNKDVKGLAKFAGNEDVDSEAIIKDAAAHSYVHKVFKSYEFKDLIKEKVNGVEYLMCKAYTVTTDANDEKTTRIFQLYMSEKDGHLTVEFYVNLNEANK